MLVGILGILTLSRLAPLADYALGLGPAPYSKNHGNITSSHTAPFTEFSNRFYRENFGPHSGKGITDSMRVFTTVVDTMTLLYLFVLGCCYEYRITNKRSSMADAGDLASDSSLAIPPHGFKAPCCHCQGGLSIWAWSIFGWSSRMGDTYHAAGVTNFWAPLAVHATGRVGALVIGAIPGMVGGVPTLSMKIVECLVFANWRQALRERLGAPAPQLTNWVFAGDVTLYLFLPYCLISQEALEVDRASETKVVGCSLQSCKYSGVDSKSELFLDP